MGSRAVISPPVDRLYSMPREPRWAVTGSRLLATITGRVAFLSFAEVMFRFPEPPPTRCPKEAPLKLPYVPDICPGAQEQRFYEPASLRFLPGCVARALTLRQAQGERVEYSGPREESADEAAAGG